MGTITNGVTLGVPGVTGVPTGMYFNGTGRINCSPIPDIHAGHTFEAWAWFTPISGALRSGFIVARLQFSPGGVVFFLRANQTATLPYQIGADYLGVTNNSSSLTIAHGVWRHVVVTHDGLHLRFYVDGVLDSQASGNTVFTDGATGIPLTLGWSDIQPAHDITLQDIAIYLRPLTAQEIADHYALQFQPDLTVPFPEFSITALKALVPERTLAPLLLDRELKLLGKSKVLKAVS
jgi:hypothetical protein